MNFDRSANRAAWRMTLLSVPFFALSITLSSQPAPAADFEPEEHAGKVLVLDFWASWCVPCRRSFPWLNTMHEKYAEDGLVIVGVNLDMERADAVRFLDEYPAAFKIVYDDDKELAKRFEVIAMPSSYLIGRDGKLAAQHLGFKVKKQAEYEAAIRQALSETGTENE
jgi:thiol-disulfide isomerase/thioredoxin